jgi:hypothetical protein
MLCSQVVSFEGSNKTCFGSSQFGQGSKWPERTLVISWYILWQIGIVGGPVLFI